MKMGLEDAASTDVILRLLKDALLASRDSSDRLYGLARGLEIGILTLEEARWNAHDSIGHLQKRSLRLSQSRDDYHLGVALGINFTIDVVSALSDRVSAAMALVLCSTSYL
jgi:hypothetical protein